MSNSHHVDKIRGPKPKVDLNDIEMVFGSPNSPNGGVKPELHVTNERTHGREHTTSKLGGEGGPDSLSAQPLLEPHREPPKPPLAGPEIDDIDEVDDHPSAPYPGIDDGLLEPEDKHGHDKGGSDKDGHGSHDSHPPTHDEGVGTDDGKWWPSTDHPDHPDHAYHPDHHHDFDSVNGLDPKFGSDGRPFSPLPDPANNPNTYQQRKNLAQGMMDLALLSANANQLRYVLESSSHPYYFPSVAFISISIILQIGVGVLLIMNSQYDVTNKAEVCKAVKINNLTVLGVFLVTIVNVFITSFSVASTSVATGTGGAIVQQAG